MVLGDVTIDIGTIKCLVTLAVDLNMLNERGNYTLSAKDLVIVGIHPTESSDGNFVYQAFQEAVERLGGIDAVKGIVTDQASEMKKGGSLLKEGNAKIKLLYDIPHKLSLVLEKQLKKDVKWIAYSQQLTTTKRLVQQTELAALQPPNQRGKGRFMNIGLYIKWPKKIFKAKAEGNLDEISEERYQKYFGWLSDYQEFLQEKGQMFGIVEILNDTIRKNGLSLDVYNHLLDTFKLMPLEDNVRAFVGICMNTVYEEVAKLDDEQTVPISTEILESTFGSYKYHSAKGGQGITGNSLTIALLVGNKLTHGEICQALETTSVSKMMHWVGERIGNTLSKARDRFFPKVKRTGFAGDFAAA